MIYAVAGAILLLGLLLRLRGREAFHPLAIGLACLALGFLVAGTRAHWLAAPILDFRYYGPVEGRIVMIDRSQSGRTRLTLDRVVLYDLPPGRIPARVRVSLHGDQTHLAPEPGQTVILTGHLSAPQGPVEPGGFDFRRMAYFDRLGAVGYTRLPALLLEPRQSGEVPINRLRADIRAGVEARIPGDPGAFAAAILTGDRAGIDQPILEDLRRSNLAHLLAISGLHMALLAGFVFAAIRYGLALVPPVALRLPTKKIAAIAALVAAAVYLALSGGSVATERAFVMVGVMLTAVVCDRRALSLRSVAMAAMVLLLTQPEVLFEPGFQMSFAATVALVVGFSALQERGQLQRLPRWLRPVATVVLSSLLAGLATAPVAAAHFNRVSNFGLLANVLAVPVMGTAVMPSAVVAALLAPFGLEGPALWLMEQGVRWILAVAGFVAGLEGAVRPVAAPPAPVLPLLSLGALWCLMWRGPIRLLGLPAVMGAFLLWQMAERPGLLISADGAIAGVMGPQGRALSVPKGAGFAARQWLENDGDMADQALAAERPGFQGAWGNRRVKLGDWRIAHLKGKKAPLQLTDACRDADLVVIAAQVPDDTRPYGCLIIDQGDLDQSGALAGKLAKGGGLVLTAANRQARLWDRFDAAPIPRVVLPAP